MPVTTLDPSIALIVIDDVFRPKDLPVALVNATEKIISRLLERRSAAS
jgi:hypothetical protein